MLTIAGCEKSEESSAQNSPTPEQTVETQKDEDESQTEESVQEEEKKQPEEQKTGAADQKTEVTIYKIDPDSGELTTEVRKCEELNVKILWDYLIETGAVPEGSKALSLVQDGKQLQLDVDNTFGEWLRSYGTAGEQEIMSCVVNTYLDAYGAQSIQITEEGQTLRSGHMEYDEYMEKY